MQKTKQINKNSWLIDIEKINLETWDLTVKQSKYC